MSTITVNSWITNAAVVLGGLWGDVTRHARAVGRSRQALYDQARKVQDAVADARDGTPPRAALLEQLRQLRHENDRLWDWLGHTVEFPPDRQEQFTITAAAMGLSLAQIGTLLALVLGERAAPGRATLGRVVQAAGRAAGRVLRRLDASCRALILVGCLDEIFCGRRPVLMGIEPHTQVWFLGRLSPDRQGPTWQAALQDWPALEFVLADAGSGLQAGIAAERRRRGDAGRPPLECSLDLFHTAQEAHRVLGHRWRALEKLWSRAEAAEAAVAADRQQGRRSQGSATAARQAWRRVATAWAAYETEAAAWRRIRAALSLWHSDGRLNDRAAATTAIAAALPALAGRPWEKLRRYLAQASSLGFLDRVHEQLQRAEGREALVRLWWLRHVRTEGPTAAAVVQRVVCQGLGADWGASYRRVAAVLRGAVRASSAVEGLNSVLRMHQSRHRRLSQGLLDLKRLYWNSRRFRSGRRRGRSPYELLGLERRGTTFWELLRGELDEAAPPEKVSSSELEV